MSDTQAVLIDLLAIHGVLFLISFVLILRSKGTILSRKFIQIVFTAFIPLLGPIAGIYIHLSDRMKPPPPHDPNWTPMQNDAPSDWGTGHH